MRYNTLLTSFCNGDVSEAADMRHVARTLRTHNKGISAFMLDISDKLESKVEASVLRSLLASFKLHSSAKAGLDFDVCVANCDAAIDVARELLTTTKSQLFEAARVKSRDNFIKCGELSAYIKLCSTIIDAASGVKASVSRFNASVSVAA